MCAKAKAQYPSNLCYEQKNGWDLMNAKEKKVIFDFNEAYKQALDQGKTEREFCRLSVDLLEKAGFKKLEDQKTLKPGDRVYRLVRGKGVAAFVIGEESPFEGYNLVGAHIDSPRVDIKPHPLYEKNELAFFKTHYYGGIKKYHWAATALAIHGFLQLKSGRRIEIKLGEDEKDPVFTFTDLLPHLGKEQMARKASEVVQGEELNLLIGSTPVEETDLENRFKLQVLRHLYDRYGIVESDLLTAELEIVPVQNARDIGFDQSMIGAYGQDDRVCAYTALRAVLDMKAGQRTGGVLLFDKEEVGSGGNTGAKSLSYLYILQEVAAKMVKTEPTQRQYADMIEKTCLLSSDVCNAYDPTFADVSEPLNSAYCNKGLGFFKYTGSGGKYNTTDANGEFFADVAACMDEAGIPWQVGELGKVDFGGGGTIAQYFANYGIQVVDCGVPVLSMHSCFEVTSKWDVYQAYRAYHIFLEAFKENKDRA